MLVLVVVVVGAGGVTDWLEARSFVILHNIRDLRLRLTRASAVGAGHQLFSLARLPVGILVSQAEVAVVVGDDDTVGALLSCWWAQ